MGNKATFTFESIILNDCQFLISRLVSVMLRIMSKNLIGVVLPCEKCSAGK